MSKKILIAGGGGFIGGHLAKEMTSRGHAVRVVDIKPVDQWYQQIAGAENIVANLEEKEACFRAAEGCDEVFNLACNMGGMGFIENNRALCMLSILINTHLLMAAREHGVKKYLYSSSACVYAAGKQTDTAVTALREEDAYPAMPEDGYGWEKLFSERMCRHFSEDYGLETRVARYHNVYGEHGTYDGGREKAPAAICQGIGKPVPHWSVPKFMFDGVALVSSRLRYKVKKLLGDEFYSTDKLEALGFLAEKSLRDFES